MELTTKKIYNVSKQCMDLLLFCHKDNVVQSSYKNQEGLYEITISGYDTEYIVTCEYSEKHEPVNYHNGDRGSELESGGYDYDILTAVVGAIICDDDSTEIAIDDFTSKQLLDILEIND